MLYGGDGADTLNAGIGGLGYDEAVFDYSGFPSGPVTFSLAGVDPTQSQVVSDGFGGTLTIGGVESLRVLGNIANDSLTAADSLHLTSQRGCPSSALSALVQLPPCQQA